MRNPILQKKREEHEKVIKKYWFSQNKIIWIITLKDKDTLKYIIEGIKTLSINCIIISENTSNEGKQEWENIYYTQKIDEETLLWADFIIADKHVSDLEKYMKLWVTPIISKSNYLSSLLSEFNPIKNEGNAFIYEQDNEWQIFYALCRYLENSKFSFDNQNLINNVIKI